MKPVAATPTRDIDYALLSGIYAAGTALIARSSRGTGDPIEPAELVPLGVAAFTLSKALTREKVESWVRRPFVEERPDGMRRPRGTRMQYAIGELLGCTRCTGAWAALSLVGLRLRNPHLGRVAVAVGVASAVNDFSHAAFARATTEANVAAERAERYSSPVDSPGPEPLSRPA